MTTHRGDGTRMTNDPTPGETSTRMLQLLNASLTAQALHVAAKLRLADLLSDGPVTTTDLAATLGAHRPSLYRLMRMLTGVGVFCEEADGRFALTALGSTLRSAGPDSVRDWALFIGAPDIWQGFSRLQDTIMTGKPGFVLAHGTPLWDYLAGAPELGTAFHRWMTRQSDQHNAAIVAAYDFSAFRVVADVGGGQGATLAAILTAHPPLRGILLDLPQVVANPAPLEAAGVADRCEVTGGDMLREVPRDADAYLIKRVLMDWGDDQAVRILRNCAEVLPASGKVLVVEMVLPPGNDPGPAKFFDLLMLLHHKRGRIRTEAEFRHLFAAAGLRLARNISTASPNSILEGVAT